MNEFLTPKSFISLFLFSFFYFLTAPSSYSQSALDINPYRYSNPDKSIQSSSFVDESTGRATFTIDLAEAKTNSLSQPITLTYSSNGFNVNDKYSTYGKGWSLNYGAVITRDINYYADEQDKIKYHDISNPTPLTSPDLNLFIGQYCTDFRNSFDHDIGLRTEYFYNTFIETDKVDLEVDYFYYNINGFKNMFSILEYINNPFYTHPDNISDMNISRLYSDHKFIDIGRKKNNSAFLIKSQGVKYSFIGGDKIWKRTREFSYINNGSSPQIDWNSNNIATGFTTYNLESIEPDNGNGVNEKINFTYQTLPVINKTIESFHFKSLIRETGTMLDWSYYNGINGAMFFYDFRDSCMETCLYGLTPKDPSYSMVAANCMNNCTAIAMEQDSNNVIDWRNSYSQSPEIIREEKKLIKSISSKEYDIEFSYNQLNNDPNNIVLNELLVYQKSSNNKFLLFKYKFSYLNYSNTVNLLKEVSKYTGSDVLIDRHKFDYYNENLLSTYDMRTFSVNFHNNYKVSSNSLESAQTAELKEVFLSDEGSIKYNYINEPNDEGVIVSNLELKSGKDILNYKFVYNNSVPNYYVNEQELVYATVAEDCDQYYRTRFYPDGYAASVSKYKEIERPYRPSYFKNVEITLPNGSKTRKSYDLYSSQVTLTKEELFAGQLMVKKTDYNYKKETITTDINGEYIWSRFLGYKMFLNAALRKHAMSSFPKMVDGYSCEESINYKSFNVYSIQKNADFYLLESIKTKEFTSTNPIENSVNYEYDLTNFNYKFPLKIKTTDSKGRVNSTNFIYDTKYWKPLQELNYSEGILLSKSEKKYDNLGQMESEKIKSYKSNPETLLSDIAYTYKNGRINSVNDKLTGSKKQYISSDDGFTTLYELEFLSDEADFIYNGLANLQLDYNNPKAYFSSLADIYGMHFKKGYLYNPYGVYKIFDANKQNTTILYDAAGRVVKKLDNEGNLLESNNYYSKGLGTIPLSAYNETLYGNYNWSLNYEDCYDTPDNSSYNLGCVSSNNTGTYNIKLHFNGNVYDFTCSDYEYIFDAASNAGINIPILYGAGVDGTNLSRLKYGKVDQSDQSFLGDCKMANGYILLESSRPLCDCEIFFVGD